MQAERISFNVSDSQRLLNSWEMYCLQNSELKPLARSLYATLGWLRDKELKAFISKKRLLEASGIGSRSTLDRALEELEAAGFLILRGFEYFSKGLKRKKWAYFFPKFRENRLLDNSYKSYSLTPFL